MDDQFPSGPRNPGFGTPPVTSNGNQGQKREGERLPPPMFPPGTERQRQRSVSAPLVEGGIPEDAFILPDEPIRGRAHPDMEDHDDDSSSGLGDALIDPDAPIIRREAPRKPEDFEAVLGRDAADLDQGVVTGMGDDDHLHDAGGRVDGGLDPALAELTRVIEKLAESLRAKGEAGLRTLPEMSRFEATLRGYCVGYLAGARERPES
jgi:hypothetical protein